MSTAADLPHEVLIDVPLAEELQRHGVHLHAGDRVRLEIVPDLQDDDDSLLEGFIGRFDSDEPNLAERSEDILRAEFGRQ